MGNKNGVRLQKKRSPDVNIEDIELTEDEIQLLLAVTQMDRFRIIDWHQDFLKDCPNEKLDRAKFVDTYKLIFDTDAVKPDNFTQNVFKVFDMGNTGQIDLVEFFLAISTISDGDLGNRLLAVYRLYDLDRTGSVDAKDLAKILNALYVLKEVSNEEKSKPENTVESKVKFLLNGNDVLTEPAFIDALFNDPFISNLMLSNVL